MNALGDAGTLCGHAAGVPDDLVRGGSIHTVSLGNPGKQVGNWLPPTPVLPQRLSQLGAEGYVAVTLAFALADMDQHKFFIDVAGFPLHQFSASHPRGVEGHQHGPIQQVGGGLDEPGDFVRTPHRGQTKRDFGEWDVLPHIGAPERLHEEKPERGGALRYRVPGQLSRAKQVGLKLPDMCGAELVRGA